MFPEDQLLPLSALQHWLYCPRQCALIHLEQAWAENRFTAEGQLLHKKAHDGADESKAGIRITRGMAVRSLALGISGQCDVVEFHGPAGDFRSQISDFKGREIESAPGLPAGDFKSQISEFKEREIESAPGLPAGDLKSQISNLKYTPSVLPVEYKRGKPKSHRADEVQLCAQAMCLEEMLNIEIPTGHLYYGEKRRRTEVSFDAGLRRLTTETAAALHAMIDSRETPAAEYLPRRCDACSLIDLCQPKSMRFKRGVQAWFSANLKSET